MIYSFERLEEFCDLLCGEPVVYLAAAGTYGKMVGKYLNYKGISWKAYLDGNEQLQGKTINEKIVCSYQDIDVDKRSVVVICTVVNSKEIEETLLKQGFEDKNIIRFDDRLLLGWISYELEQPEEIQMRKIKSLKGIGREYKRCFIIGTGPSLSIQDLELLKNEFTFSVNSIINCFHMTEWRPTCYVVLDPAQKDEIDEYGMANLSKECKYLLFAIKSGLLKDAGHIENAFWFNSIEKPYDDCPEFSVDASEIVYEASTVIYSALQLAYYMGFKEIYMLGIDLGFSCVRTLEGNVERNGKQPATAEFLKTDKQKEPIYELDKIIRGYKSAKQYAQENGLIIKNATRGGYLEELERVNLEEILKNQ